MFYDVISVVPNAPVCVVRNVPEAQLADAIRHGKMQGGDVSWSIAQGDKYGRAGDLASGLSVFDKNVVLIDATTDKANRAAKSAAVAATGGFVPAPDPNAAPVAPVAAPAPLGP